MQEIGLQAGETVIWKGRLHWIILALPLVLFVAGLVAILFQPLTAIVLLLASTTAILGAYAKYATTEIAVTSRRVVYRTGLLSRRLMEMNRDRIESIDVTQSILGRLLDFGMVAVKGTGGGIEAIHNVVSPFVLRDHVALRRADTGAVEDGLVAAE